MERYKKVRKEYSSFNEERGDLNICASCRLPIALKGFTKHGQQFYDRENRVDCEERGKYVSYHLECYDLLVFGRVMPASQKQLEKWRLRNEA